MEVLKARFAKHRDELDLNDPRDFIDELLIEQKRNGTEELFTGKNSKHISAAGCVIHEIIFQTK